MRPGVFAIVGSAPTWEQAVLAAVLAAGPTAHASHATAGRLWELPVEVSDAIEITTVLERQPRLPGVRTHRSGLLCEADCRVVSGIPTLSVARLVVDMSSRLEMRDLVRLLDEGLRRGLVSIAGLKNCADRLPLAPGRSPKKIERLLHRRVPGYDPGDSELETLAYDALVDGGLPAPVRQYRVRIGGRTCRIDLAYPDEHIAIELDGYDCHRVRRAFDDDRRRQNALVAAGWTILRFTSESSSSEIVDAVRAALLFVQKRAL